MTLKRNTIGERHRWLLKDRPCVEVSLMSQRRSALLLSAGHKKEFQLRLHLQQDLFVCS